MTTQNHLIRLLNKKRRQRKLRELGRATLSALTKERSIRREVPAGEAVPNVYGLAYRAYDRNVSICYPIPINMVVATARRLWKWCQGGYSYQFCRPSKVSHIVLSGQEQHELFNYLTPFIEKSGKTWKVTTRDGSQFISDVIIE